MKKTIAVIATCVVTIFVIFYFSKSGPFKKMEPAAARAQGHQQHGTPVAEPKTDPPAPAGKADVSKPQAAQQVEEAPTIEIPPEKQRMLGVKTAVVSVQPLTKILRTVGYVEYDQRRLQTINAKFEGWVEKLYVNFTGDYVKRGSPVADVYSPELWATQQEFINAVKWAKGMQQRGSQSSARQSGATDAPDVGAMIRRDAATLVEATRQRLRLWDISDAQIKRIEESEKPIRTVTIYSPYSGYVLQKNVTQGMRIMAGASLLDVADLSSIWITADIYQFEMTLVKVGDPATVSLSYFPDRQFTTRIDYIYPSLEGETRTLKARFAIPNEGGRLKPQMFANVEMRLNLGRKLAVPSESVINTGLRYVSYVDKGDGYFEPREVTVGTQADGLTEITAGLKAGDKVASSANFLIDSEAKLRGVEPLPRAKPGPTQEPAKPSSPPPAHSH